MADVERGRDGTWTVVLNARDAAMLAAVVDRWAALAPTDGVSVPAGLRDLRRVLGRAVRLSADVPEPVEPTRRHLPPGAVTAADVAERLGVDDVPGLIRAGELLGEYRGRPTGWLVLERSVTAFEERRKRAGRAG